MNENFAGQQSLETIKKMLVEARIDLNSKRYYFLMWGRILFLLTATQFVLKTIVHSEYHDAVWSLVVVGF